MLRQRILVIIQASLGISINELKSRLPEAKSWEIHNALADLRKAGEIEPAGHGHYRVPSVTPAAPDGQPETMQSFVQPPSIARLMAGR